uniref:hypothetical protein n=1 Tax=Olsenella uli TaxID=133926 RepID=UPI0028E3FA05|nr:hypothetical protein [Olsenella uli]
MPTSDERREVAERLRIGADVPSIGGFTLATLINAALTDGQPMPTNHAELMLCLADLIDPTCHDYGGEEGTNGEMYDFACDACGYACDLPQPNYCPECGCRVTGGERR